MQEVSNEWKQAHQQTILNESFVEVSLHVADPEALKNVFYAENGATYLSTLPKPVEREDEAPSPYCTLEQNLWCLDGQRKAIPESEFGYQGFSSDVLSDDTCIFSTKFPVLTLMFTDIFETPLPGVTITWSNTYGEFADTFEIIAYNGNTVVASKEVTQNRSIKSVVFLDIANYDRIEIVVKKWCLPNHRARVEELRIGCFLVYGKSELLDYSHTHSVDPAATSLPKNEIRFSINNLDGAFNPYNPNGLTRYLSERIEVKVRYGMKIKDKIEWIPGGTFFLSEWDAPQNGISADFTARDVLEFMYDNYRYTGSDKSTNLLFLANGIISSASLPEKYQKFVGTDSSSDDSWDINPELQQINGITPYLAFEDSTANSLQMVANAGRNSIDVDREGVFRIAPLPDTINEDYIINAFNSYAKPELSLSKPLAEVRVKVYDYHKDGSVDTTEYAYTAIGKRANVDGEIITIDNPLITREEMAEETAKWIFDLLSRRMTVDASWRGDVRLDPLDIILLETEYGTKQIRVLETEFKFNGAFRTSCKGKVISDG